MLSSQRLQQNILQLFSFLFTEMAYALYRGTRLGLALQEALGEMEEYEQISPNVRTAVLRKFDEVQDVLNVALITIYLKLMSRLL